MSAFFRKLKFTAQKLLPSREQALFRALAALLIISGLISARALILATTVVAPKVEGQYREGVVGSPQRFNPLWSALNEADHAVVTLIYASLFEPDGQGGYIPSLAEEFSTDETFRTWTVKLRNGLSWHDGRAVSAGDIRFMLSLIQDPRVSSPLLTSFAGVEAEEVDAHTLVFKLPSGRSDFIGALAYLRPLPRHIWESIPTVSLPLAEHNIRPVGSGPWRFKGIATAANGSMQAVTLERNPSFFGAGPYLRELTLRFFADPNQALEAWKNGNVEGLSGVSAVLLARQSKVPDGTLVRVRLPRAFAIFINPATKSFLADSTVRKALDESINRVLLAREVYGGHATPLADPFGLLPVAEPMSPEEVRASLEAAGWRDANEDGLYDQRRVGRRTVKEDLAFKMSLPNVPSLIAVGEKLRDAWRNVGIAVELDVKETARLERETIAPRAFDALLFGETMAQDFDPFPFWHSSQAVSGGLNLAGWQDSSTDGLIQELRGTRDRAEREVLLRRLADRLAREKAAIFLFNPYELWWVDRHLAGVPQDLFLPQLSSRLSSARLWYRATERVWRTQANEERAIQNRPAGV